MTAVLRMEHITKRFGEMYANRNIDLTIEAGKVHTLLGENGAGKSTLMNILMGIYQPSDGNIYFHGKKVRMDSPGKAVKMGIGMVHQHFMLIDAMTVFENIILGVSGKETVWIHKNQRRKEILELMERYGLEIDLDKQITDISVGEQQRVEILKTLYRGAQLLILDEPTAALTDLEVESLFQIIRRLTAEDKAVIFISHKMREVLEISDTITILRAGETVATLSGKGAKADELAGLMIGHELTAAVYEKKKAEKPLLSLEEVCYNARSKHSGVRNIAFSIGRGEILGIAGVDGNGQSQLAQLVTGVLAPEQGKLFFDTEQVRHFSPAAFIRRGVAHIPEDRNKMGLVGNMSVKENLILKSLKRPAISAASGWYLKKRKITAYARVLERKYDIRCASVDQETRSLSGGNQQKIILAREIEQNPALLVAVHPTRGLDIGAARYVHDQMILARDRGCGVLLISADFDEVLKLSDRIGVMFEGQIVGIYDGSNPPIGTISLAMAGKTDQEQETIHETKEQLV